MCKNLLNLRNVAKIAVACLAVMYVPFTASGQVCQIGSTNYNMVETAITAVSQGGASATTIKMLQDYQVNNGMYINNRKITFDLNGRNLTFYNNTTNNSGRALDVDNGSYINYTGTGNFKVIATKGTALKVYNSQVSVKYVNSEWSNVIEVSNQGTVSVYGDVESSNAVSGAVYAHHGGIATIYGHITAYYYGVHATNDDGGVHSQVYVYGDITITSSIGLGVHTENSARVYAVGKITTPGTYVQTGSSQKTQSQYSSVTSDGYYTYTDNNSYVYVLPATACIGTRNYETIDKAFTAVPTGGATATTVKLLKDYTSAVNLDVSNKNINFNLNGYTLTQNGYLACATNGKFITAGSGAMNINVTGNNIGIDAEDGSTVRITGNVAAVSGWAIDAKGSTVHVEGNVSNTGAAAGIYAYNGGRAEINGTFTTGTRYIQTGSVIKNKTDFTLPSDLAGYAKYTDGTNSVYVAGAAPKITGGTPSVTVQSGYTVMSTAAFSATGDPAPRITKTSGDSHITWNDVTKKIDIASGLTTGSYSAVLTAQNGITPNGTFTFTFIVGAPPICQIGNAPYTSLDDAILYGVSIGGTTPTTIKLLADIVYPATLNVNNQNIMFNLNGFNLDINSVGDGIHIDNGGAVDFTGKGTFTVTSNQVEPVGTIVGNGILVQNGGKCHVSSVTTGAVKSIGINISGKGSSVTVDGDVNATMGTNIPSAGATGIQAATGTTVTLGGDVHAAILGVQATGGTVKVNGSILKTLRVGYGVEAQSGGKITIDGEIKSRLYIKTGTVVKTPTDFMLPSDLAGHAKYTDGTNTVYVKGTAPTFTGTTAASDFLGYTDFTTGAFTTTGDPSPKITKTSGNALITWNDSTQSVAVAAGLAAGSYPVVFTAANGITPNATLTFTLTIINNFTGIEDVQANNPVKAWVANGTLHVSGLTAGKPWRVYTVTGVLVTSPGPSKGGEEVTTPLPGHGVYIVQSGNWAVKVVN